MSASFFSRILEQAAHWQVHIPPTDAFGDMVLRPLGEHTSPPAGEGLINARWSKKAHAFNCEVDVNYLTKYFNKYTQYIDNIEFISDNYEINFLALRLLSMAEQPHPMPDARQMMLRAFGWVWACHSPQMKKQQHSYTHGFLRDLRIFTEKNLHFRARYSTQPHEKSPIQKGESCAIVAKNGLLVLRFLGASIDLPARFLEA